MTMKFDFKFTTADIKLKVIASIDDAESKGVISKSDADSQKNFENKKIIITNEAYAVGEQLDRLVNFFQENK